LGIIEPCAVYQCYIKQVITQLHAGAQANASAALVAKFRVVAEPARESGVDAKFHAGFIHPGDAFSIAGIIHLNSCHKVSD